MKLIYVFMNVLIKDIFKKNKFQILQFLKFVQNVSNFVNGVKMKLDVFNA